MNLKFIIVKLALIVGVFAFVNNSSFASNALSDNSASKNISLSADLGVELCYDSADAELFNKTVEIVAYGTLVDKAPDIFIDPLWFGSAQGGPVRFDAPSSSNWNTGYYGEIVTFKTPATSCYGASHPILTFNTTRTNLHWGEITYGGFVSHKAHPKYIYLKKNSYGNWIPVSSAEYSADYLLWDTEYTVLVYGDNNDAKGTWQLDLIYETCQSYSHCNLKIQSPYGSSIHHCYTTDGILWMDASAWVTGCTKRTYKWTTPAGTVHGPVLDGHYGYGSFLCEVTCHDATCGYEVVSYHFALKDYCHYNSCHFKVKPPMGSTLEHCYQSDGILWMNASTWVSGCSTRTYKWTTPKGTVNSAVLDGNYGYGHFTCEVVCHEAGSCHYVVEKISFYLKDHCYQHCTFDVKSPLASVVNHCYDSDGIVWVDGSKWVSGCVNATYKWSTPTGSVSGAVLDGKYGYGNFILTVTCHDSGSCHYEVKKASFVLKEKCHKQPYVIHCPSDKWVKCEDELWDLNIYGNPYYIHNGHKIWIKDDKVHHHLNDCNSGYITREWKVKDPHGHWTTCEQHIYVGESNISYHDIDWPKKELTLEGCYPSIKPEDMPYGAREPKYKDDGCSKLGHSYKDEVYWFDGTCKKVIRRWTVIDWCNYTSNGNSNHGKYSFTQTIKISNTDKPDVTLPDDIEVYTSDCKKAKVEMEDVEVSSEACGGKYEIRHNSPYAYKQGDNASGEYPVGTTKVEFKVKYGCGYSKVYSIKVKVESNSDPLAYCIAKLAIPLRGVDTDGDGDVDDGEVEIWAKDFNLASTDPCFDDLTYSFSPDEVEMSKTFTCAEIGINELNIYITNESGVQTYCTVQLDIQNNAADIPDCEPSSGDADDESDDDEVTEEEDTEEEVTDEEEETEEEVTEDEEVTEEEVTEGEEDTENDAQDESDEEDDESSSSEIAHIRGQVMMNHGEPVEHATLALFTMQDEVSSEQAFEIVEVKIDSFIGGSGAVLYITRRDTIFSDQVESTQAMQSKAFSNSNGEYEFHEVSMYQNYMIEPSMESKDNIGVNDADADRLYAHLTGSDEITDPYLLLAADIDQSGSLNFDDLKALWRYIDDIDDSLEDASMIFVDADYQFQNAAAPWNESYANVHNISDLSDKEYVANFIAIQIGDLIDGNPTPMPSFQATNGRERNKLDAVVTPNPFSTRTSIRFDNPETQMGTISLYDVNGAKVYESSSRFGKGIERINISNLQLPTAGVYFYNIQLGENILRGKLLKVD